MTYFIWATFLPTTNLGKQNTLKESISLLDLDIENSGASKRNYTFPFKHGHPSILQKSIVLIIMLDLQP